MSDVKDIGAVGDDLATLLARREHARPNRITWTLLTLLVLAVGFIGGAVVEKRVGSSEPALPDFVAMVGAGGPAGDLARGPAQGGSATVGTVTLVDGSNLYIIASDGATVKVSVPDTASVTTRSPLKLADLAVGTDVVIEGQADAEGVVTATSVAQDAPTSPTTTPTPSTSTGDN